MHSAPIELACAANLGDGARVEQQCIECRWRLALSVTRVAVRSGADSVMGGSENPRSLLAVAEHQGKQSEAE